MIRVGVSGGLRIEGADGRAVDLSSRKARIMLAMLALAPDQERAREWFAARLWGSRPRTHALQSLRREIMALRRLLGDAFQSDHLVLRLEKGAVELDPDWPVPGGALLDGVDCPGEEGYREWRDGLRRPPAKPRVTPPPAATAASDFGLRPALAILPLTNESGDPALEALCAGLSDDLIDRISRLRWLPVVARGSAFLDLGEGQATGARYILQGALRRGLSGLRYIARLTDGEGGHVLWNHALDLPQPYTESLLYDLVTGLVAALGARIENAEQRRVLAKRKEDLEVADLIWLGRWHYHRLTADGMKTARGLFEEAVSTRRDSGEAHLNRAWSVLFETWRTRGGADEIRSGLALAQEAVRIDPLDSRAHFLTGAAECWLGNTDRSEEQLRHAIEINPSCFHAYGQLGSVLYLDGRPREAIEMMMQARRLSPHDQQLFFVLTEIGMAWLMLEQAEEALAFARQAVMRRAGYWYAHVVRVCALRQLGRVDEAVAALADLYDTKCQFRLEYIDWLPFRDRAWNTMLKKQVAL